MIQDKIRELVQYGLLTGLVSAEDEIYTTNRLLELFQIEDYPYRFGEKIEQTEEEAVKRLPDLLTEMMDYAVENGILQEDGIVYRDLFDTKIMSCLVGRPSEIIRRFYEEYEKSPEAATNFFYKFSQDTDYIRRYRVCRDEKWVTPTKYGDLDITINLSKPEKDPKAIAAARLAKQCFCTHLCPFILFRVTIGIFNPDILVFIEIQKFDYASVFSEFIVRFFTFLVTGQFLVVTIVIVIDLTE